MRHCEIGISSYAEALVRDSPFTGGGGYSPDTGISWSLACRDNHDLYACGQGYAKSCHKPTGQDEDENVREDTAGIMRNQGQSLLPSVSTQRNSEMI